MSYFVLLARSAPLRVLYSLKQMIQFQTHGIVAETRMRCMKIRSSAICGFDSKCLKRKIDGTGTPLVISWIHVPIYRYYESRIMKYLQSVVSCEYDPSRCTGERSPGHGGGCEGVPCGFSACCGKHNSNNYYNDHSNNSLQKNWLQENINRICGSR